MCKLVGVCMCKGAKLKKEKGKRQFVILLLSPSIQSVGRGAVLHCSLPSYEGFLSNKY